MTFASLPMYDLPELRSATDTLWQAIAAELERRGLPAVPHSLERARSHEVQWADPALLFGQSCGYPITHRFAQALRVVATPVYAAQGCRGARYSSAIVVRDTASIAELADLRGGVAAINDMASYSGASALAAVVAPHVGEGPFFRAVRISGSHHESLALVASGAAAVAAIDCVTHALLARWCPEAVAGTRVLAYSPEAPALPYVTRREASEDIVAQLRSALGAVITTTEPSVVAARARLLLDGVEVLAPDAYLSGVAADHVNRVACGLTEPPAREPATL